MSRACAEAGGGWQGGASSTGSGEWVYMLAASRVQRRRRSVRERSTCWKRAWRRTVHGPPDSRGVVLKTEIPGHEGMHVLRDATGTAGRAGEGSAEAHLIGGVLHQELKLLVPDGRAVLPRVAGVVVALGLQGGDQATRHQVGGKKQGQPMSRLRCRAGAVCQADRTGPGKLASPFSSKGKRGQRALSKQASRAVLGAPRRHCHAPVPPGCPASCGSTGCSARGSPTPAGPEPRAG